MITIYKAQKGPFKILGKQSIKKDVCYRLFNYCLLRKFENDFVLYNNMTKSAVILTEKEANAVKKLPSKIDDNLRELVEEWYLVPDDNNDLKLCDQLIDTIEIFEKKDRIVNYTILTTTDCNARCFYCFEHTLKRKSMSVKTALDVANYIIKNCKGEPVNIKWFGGEPLFNSEAIDIICDKLIENNIEYASTMISNGYLFNEENLKKAKEKWHLKKVQITLDGTEEIYNKIKAYIYKDIPSAFITVTDNIEKLANLGIHTRIRLNLTNNNRENLYSLIDWISERYPNKENLSMYCAPVWDTDKERWEMDWMGPSTEKNIMNAYIYTKGFTRIRAIKDSIMRGCKAQRYDSVVVMPNGDLGKCDTLLDDKMYGNIYSDEVDKNALNFWLHKKVIEQCKSCIAYPDCAAYDACPNFIRNCELVTKSYHEERTEQNMRAIYDEYKKQQKEII